MKHIDELQQEYKEFSKIDKLFWKSIYVNAGLENSKKNRYNDVLPYNFTLAKLSNNEYINANYINLFPGCKYISTQAPIPSSVDDFFTLIQDELKVNMSVNIIMLTELNENGRIKCFDYLKIFEERVKDFNEKFEYLGIKYEFNGLIEIREFQIGDKILRHIWIRKWPDYGVPDLNRDNNFECIKLMKEMDLDIHDAYKCNIVHCSAGVGRSGTFIGLHYMYNNFRIDDDFVFNTVVNMRKCRMMMVQKFEQYVYLNEMYERIKRQGQEKEIS